jgi:hypothetical protein
LLQQFFVSNEEHRRFFGQHESFDIQIYEKIKSSGGKSLPQQWLLGFVGALGTRPKHPLVRHSAVEALIITRAGLVHVTPLSLFRRGVGFCFQKGTLFLCFSMQAGISMHSMAGNTKKIYKVPLTDRRFLVKAMGRPTQIIWGAPQKSPRTCRVSDSLEPWQNVDHGASNLKQCKVRACHSCCFRENPTNHEQHRDGI